MAGFLNQISTQAPGAGPPQGGFVQQGNQAQPHAAPQGQGPQVTTGPDGLQYVVTAQGYIPLAQWQAAQQPVQPAQQQQGFAPQGQQQGFAPQGQQQGFAPQGQQPGFAPQQPAAQFAPQNGAQFAPQGQQQGFAPQGQQPQQPGFAQGQQQFAPQNGAQFAPQNGTQFAPNNNNAAQGPPVGGFVPNGQAAFGGQQPMAQGQQNPPGFAGWGVAAVPFSQIMSGMGALDSSSRGIYFRGDGTHIAEIQKVSGGLGKDSKMPFFSVELKVVSSSAADRNPPGYTPAWTITIDNMKYLERMKRQVKNFMVAALSSKFPGQQFPDASVNESHTAWAIGEQNGQQTAEQPLKGTLVVVTTTQNYKKDDAGNYKFDAAGQRIEGFTAHSFSPYYPNQQQPHQQQGFAPQR